MADDGDFRGDTVSSIVSGEHAAKHRPDAEDVEEVRGHCLTIEAFGFTAAERFKEIDPKAATSSNVRLCACQSL